MDQGDIGAHRGISIEPGSQILEYFHCIRRASRDAMDIGEIGVERCAVTGQLDRSLERRAAFVVPLLSRQRLVEFIVTDGKVPVQLQCFVTLMDRFVI
jgi:hypothetical protein